VIEVASQKEKALWRYLNNGVGQRWDACRHEDCATSGVPDVSFGMHDYAREKVINGWIELKVLDDWPRRPDTVVKFRSLSKEQRMWMNGRGTAGGNVWILVRVQRHYMLFHYTALDFIGTTNREGLQKQATRTWVNKIDWKDLEMALYYPPQTRRR
jgi:hypothetical protein